MDALREAGKKSEQGQARIPPSRRIKLAEFAT
jgi:hypothetical protein